MTRNKVLFHRAIKVVVIFCFIVASMTNCKCNKDPVVKKPVVKFEIVSWEYRYQTELKKEPPYPDKELHWISLYVTAKCESDGDYGEGRVNIEAEGQSGEPGLGFELTHNARKGVEIIKDIKAISGVEKVRTTEYRNGKIWNDMWDQGPVHFPKQITRFYVVTQSRNFGGNGFPSGSNL